MIQQLKELINKTEWTKDDRRLLANLLQQTNPEELERILNNLSDNPRLPTMQSQKMLEVIHKRMTTETSRVPKIRRLSYMRWVSVAAAILAIVMVWWLIETKNEVVTKPLMVQSDEEEVQPGGNRAVLTLADGTQVILDSANNGAISTQGSVTIVKLSEGELAYQSSNNLQTEVAYNTITTPRGGQYHLILADGTRVWLNAESSLRYPITFVGKGRKVELKGEGYFEVSGYEKMPFYVNVSEMQISVLGTHFNVNAYGDGGIDRTTLLEGRVAVEASGKSILLSPGEQSLFNEKGGQLRKVMNVDTEQVMAWRNGNFSFQNTSLRDVMQQISRWYDVEIEYRGEVAPRKFGGIVPRNARLEDVLKVLEESNVHFKVEKRKIIVLP